MVYIFFAFAVEYTSILLLRMVTACSPDTGGLLDSAAIGRINIFKYLRAKERNREQEAEIQMFGELLDDNRLA